MTEDAPVGPSGRRGFIRQVGMTFVAGVLVLGYEFAFDLTKPSPVSRGSFTELLEIVGYVVLLPAVLALVVTPVAWTLEALLRTRFPQLQRGSMSLGAVGIVLFVGLLSFTQHLLYSAAGWSLSRGDDIGTKVVFGVFAGAGAALATVRLGRTTDRLWLVAGYGTAVLSIPALVITTAYVRSTPHVPALRTIESAQQLNVIILSSDAVEASHLSAYGYERDTTPFLAAHVGEFMRFENAFTNNGNTTGSIAALLTGRSPLKTQVVYPPDQLDGSDALLSLPYLLARTGYHTENWAVPHYADARDQNLARAFDLDNGARQRGALLSSPLTGVGLPGWFVRDSVGSERDLVLDVLGIREMTNPYAAVSSIVGNTITDDARVAGIQEAIGSRGPFFVNTHFMATHGPNYHLDDQLFSSGQKQTRSWQTDFYDDSLRLYDGRIKQVYEALESSAKLDDTILVITSDHGTAYDVTKRIPLLIRLPQARLAGTYSPNVQRIDVAPTILEALGYAPPGWMTGISLLNPANVPDDRPIVATSTALREFSNNEGFHAGASDVIVTEIRCRWFAQRDPRGHVRTGTVQDSTSTCPKRPRTPQRFGSG